MANGMELAQQLFGQFNTAGQQHAAAVSQGSEFIVAIKKLQMAEEAQKAETEMQRKTFQLHQDRWTAEKQMLDLQLKQAQGQIEQAEAGQKRQQAAIQKFPSTLKKAQSYQTALVEGKFEDASKLLSEITGSLEGAEYAPDLLHLLNQARPVFGIPDEVIRGLSAGAKAADPFKAGEYLSVKKAMVTNLSELGMRGKSREDMRTEAQGPLTDAQVKAELLYKRIRAFKDVYALPIAVDISASQLNAEVVQGLLKSILSQTSGLNEAQVKELGGIEKELAQLVPEYQKARADYRDNMSLADLSFAVAEAYSSELNDALTEQEARAVGTVVEKKARGVMEALPRFRTAFLEMDSVRSFLTSPRDANAPARLTRIREDMAADPSFKQLPVAVRELFIANLIDQPEPAVTKEP